MRVAWREKLRNHARLLKLPRALVTILSVGFVVGIPLSVGYRALCAAPLDTYPVLAAGREEARTTMDRGPSAPSVAARVEVAALGAILQVKESDSVAFPAHAAVGLALEYGGCAPGATRDQWRKAAAHASTESSACLAAKGLARTAQTPADHLEVANALAVYAEQEPWHASNLRRVAAMLLAKTDGNGCERPAAHGRLT